MGDREWEDVFQKIQALGARSESLRAALGPLSPGDLRCLRAWVEDAAARGPGKRRGALVAFEGLDGSGKATQARMLADYAVGLGERAEVLAFPDYGTVTGALVGGHLRGEWSSGHDPRTDMVVRQCLMTVNRCEAVRRVLQLLRDGVTVVLDRWWLSSLAYGEAEGLDVRWVAEISSVLPAPDLWLLLDVPAEVGAARRQARDLNERDVPKLRRVGEVYRHLFTSPPSVGEWRVVDGTQSPDEVHAAVLRAVDASVAASLAG